MSNAPYQRQQDEHHIDVNTTAPQQPQQPQQQPQQQPYHQPQYGHPQDAVAYGIPVGAPQQQAMMMYPPLILGSGSLHMQASQVACWYTMLFWTMISVIIGSNVYLTILFYGTCTNDAYNSCIDTYPWVNYYIILWVGSVVLNVFVWLWKVPRRIEVTHTGVTVHTRITSYSLPFARMASIEILRDACCWSGAACTFPRTGFTASNDGVFFRGLDCGTSLGFSASDMNALLTVLHQTAGRPLIIGS